MTIQDLSPRERQLFDSMNLARDNCYECGLAGKMLERFPNFTIKSTPEEIAEMVDQEVNDDVSKMEYDPAELKRLKYKECLLTLYKYALSGYYKGLLHYHFTQDELDEMRMLCKQNIEQTGA